MSCLRECCMHTWKERVFCYWVECSIQARLSVFIKQPQVRRGECVRTLEPRLGFSSVLGGKGQQVWSVNVGAAEVWVWVTIWPLARCDSLQSHVIPESHPFLLIGSGVIMATMLWRRLCIKDFCKPSVMILTWAWVLWATHTSCSYKIGTAFRETGILWLQYWPCY